MHLPFLCMALFLVMQATAAGAQVVGGIEVKGNNRVEADAVMVVVKSKVGKELSAQQVRMDIRAIYGLGYFDEVRAELEQKPDGSVLIFVVKEKPAIAKISYRGHDELSLEKIKEVVDIRILGVLDLAKIRENIKKIKELYVEKGFFLAEVDYEIKKRPRNNVEVVIVLNERAKVEIKRIQIIGNHNVKSEELLTSMETRVGDFFSWLTSFGTFKKEALQRDMLRIADYYYNHGYINIKVSEPVVEISDDRESLYITITVEEGEQYRFGNFAFSGDLLVWDYALLARIKTAKENFAVGLVLSSELLKELKEQQLDDRAIKQLKLTVLDELEKEAEARIAQGIWEEDQKADESGTTPKHKVHREMLQGLKSQVLKSLLLVEPGEIFDRSQLSKSMFRIQDVYKDRGYAYAEVIPLTRTDQESRVADINFEVQKGEKVYIERIDIKGNLKTRDKVIRRQLRIYEGELYSGTGKEISRRRVNMLGFFETVDVSEKRGSGPDRMVVTFEVKERPTGTFQIGAGFSSVENFIATAQISQENLFGRGQTLSFMAQLSSLRQFFSLSFVEPYFLDTNWYFGFRVFNTQLDYFSFLRQASGGDITLGYEFADFWRFAVTYTLETVDVTPTGSRSLRLDNLFNDGWTSSLKLTLTWDTRDNRLFPSDGQFLQGSIEHASEFTLSENDFTRYTGIARYYLPVFWGFVLKSNVNVGYITSMSNEGIPIFEKYFVGGIYTIRGYRPRSIGPELKLPANGFDPASYLTSELIGGNKQLITNLEIEFPIFPQVQIRGVLFLDAGNAYGEGEGFFSERYSEQTVKEIVDGTEMSEQRMLKETFAGLYWSAGFGFRWFSPLGPLRFEWGIPLTRRPGDEDMLFEFTIGNFF